MRNNPFSKGFSSIDTCKNFCKSTVVIGKAVLSMSFVSESHNVEAVKLVYLCAIDIGHILV